jgi:hypothetical protein
MRKAGERLLSGADMAQSPDDIGLFRETLSLEGKCKEFADDLHKKLRESNTLPDDIVVGFHIRHVLDPNAPTVKISCNKRTEAESIRKQNERASLQTLNHVIDTLYYESRGKRNDRGTEGPKIERLFVWIDFLEDCSPEDADNSIEPCPDIRTKRMSFASVLARVRLGKYLLLRARHDNQHGARCHRFDRKRNSSVTRGGKKNRIGEHKHEWRCAHFVVCKDSFSDKDLYSVAEFASARNKERRDNAESDGASKTGEDLLTDYICGSEKFCNELGITHSLSGYRVITAAVYQLGRYACKTDDSNNQIRHFGPNTITVLIRSESAFGVVLGATVILDLKLDESLRATVQEEVVNFLERKWEEFVDPRFHFPKNKLFFSRAREANWGAIESAVWGKDWRLVISPEHRLAERLRDKILSGEPPRADTDFKERCTRRSAGSFESKWQSWSQLTICPVHAFLQTIRSYAGERLEGQFLTFGFVLGNPQLLTHTPRERPFPITRSPAIQGGRVFFTRDQLIKQVHLVAGPEERAVVIPYTRCDGAGPEGKIAAHLLEFDEAMEEFRAKEWAALWRDVFVPYLYYTERFPWAVAGFVGPGAVVRVFVDRTIAAYHDEKGWWDIRVEEIICGTCEEVGGQLGLLNTKHARAAGKSEGENRKREEKEKNNEKEINGIFKTVESLLSVALQMSRFANPEGKGGMIVWLAGEGKDRWNPCSPYPALQPHEWVCWKRRNDHLDFRAIQESGIVDILRNISDFPELDGFEKQYSCTEERLRKMADGHRGYEGKRVMEGQLIEIGKNAERFLRSIALTQSLNTSEPIRDHIRQRPWLRGKALTDAAGKLDYATAKLVLQATKQDGAVVVKQEQDIVTDSDGPSNGDKQPESHNVVVAFGQRLVPPGTTADSVEEQGGTRRASARALMAPGNDAVRPGSFVISVSSDGPLTIWVKREDADPAEFKIGANRES